MQLLLAALLCTILAALHTHAVLGKSLSGWRLYQPFRGGKSFCVLQASGWILFGLATLAGLCAVASGGSVSSQIHGFMCALGVVQLLGQATLLLSLAHFDATKARRTGSEIGIPLGFVAVVIVGAALWAAATIYAGGVARRAAGWAILASLVGVQALGVHYMWTLTWNFLTACCFLIESEEALATMTCIGVCSIMSPWYIGRFIFRREDFCNRAMIGLSAWACDDMLGLKGRFYLHKVEMWTLRLTFWHFDTVLHLLSGMALLQLYASSIRPVHVLGSFAFTGLWFGSLFYDHKVFDWDAVRGGRLKLLQWGSSSLWEPVKVAQIYMFKNDHIEQDRAFEDAVPGFAALIIGAHVMMAIVAALPNSGSIFFTCSFGEIVSTQSLLYVGCYCLFVGVVGSTRVVWLIQANTGFLYKSK